MCILVSTCVCARTYTNTETRWPFVGKLLGQNWTALGLPGFSVLFSVCAHMVVFGVSTYVCVFLLLLLIAQTSLSPVLILERVCQRAQSPLLNAQLGCVGWWGQKLAEAEERIYWNVWRRRMVCNSPGPRTQGLGEKKQELPLVLFVVLSFPRQTSSKEHIMWP